MTSTNRLLATFVIGWLAFSALGCSAMGNAARQKTTTDIKEVTLMYHAFVDDQKGKPPADEKDFSAWVNAKHPSAATALANLQAGGYKIYWSVNLMKLTAGAGNTVLVYPGDAPSNGGVVGFADGSVRIVTAAEFNAAAKPPVK